jgi:pSer/pThr/pTyr-binding forkhead associated (FHA) protein
MTTSPKDTLDLRVTCPMFAPRVYSVTDEKITIGRSSTCSIPIPDRFLSRLHAEIVRIDGEWFVSDSGSVNGTYLNGDKLNDRAPLRPGDRITIGDNEIVVVAHEGPALSAVLMPSDPR